MIYQRYFHGIQFFSRYVPNRGFNKFQMESMNIPMRDILQRILKRRKIRPRPGKNVFINKQR